MGENKKNVFLFPGNGIHQKNMLRILSQAHPFFEKRLKELEACARQFCEIPLLEEEKEDEIINQIRVFASEVAISEFWEKAGCCADYSIGHSLGEYAAAVFCGILTEGSLSCEMGCLDYAVLGIGVNVRQTQQQFPEELLPIVTSVEEVCGKVVPRSQLAAEILNQLEPLLPNPTAEEVLEEYRERSFLTGRKVSILQGGQARTAQVLGIDRKGRLVVQEEDGSRQALVSADRVLLLAKG